MKLEKITAIATGKARGGIKPFRQGDLDALCGVYAVVNALRYTLRQRLSPQEYFFLFIYLMMGLERAQGASASTTDGLGTEEIANLLRRSRRYLKKTFNVSLRVRRPLLGSQTHTLRQACS